MINKMFAWLMVSGTIFFTVYGQLVLKWQIDSAAQSISNSESRLIGFISLFAKPWVLSAFVSAFAASLCWMLALSKLPLSKAYPFMALSFLIVSIFSAWLFNDALNWQKIVGLILVVSGLVISSQG